MGEHGHTGGSGIGVGPLLSVVVVVLVAGWLVVRAATRRPGLRRGTWLAVASSIVLLALALALGPGRALLPSRHADVSRRLPAGDGLTMTVDILSARAGTNTIHVYLLGDDELVGMTELHVTGHLVQFSHLPRVDAVVRIGMSGLGHFTGTITLTTGYWLIELDGTAVDGRLLHAAFNAQVP